MGYRYNPNDQKFYDQLAQMSGIERRSTLDDRARNAERLKTEQDFLQAMKNLPDDYQKGFVNKRARTKLKYGEEGALEDLNTSDAIADNTAPVEPVAPMQPEAPSQRFGNPSTTGSTMGRNYSPGAVDVLEGRAEPGWNPPMANPPARPAPGSWMNETPYPAPMTNRQPVPFPPFPLTEEEVALAEIEKKPKPVEVTTANSLAPPTSEETVVKPKKDPRVSFRRFKADEFLKNNAVFQMDLPRIQPTYATMLNAEMQLAKSGKDPDAKKEEWDVLKDFETEEGGALTYNKYLNQTRPLPGVRQRQPKTSGSGAPVKVVGPNGTNIYTTREDAIGKEVPEPTEYILWQNPATGENMLIPKPKSGSSAAGTVPPAGSIPLPNKTPEKPKRNFTEDNIDTTDANGNPIIETVRTYDDGRREIISRKPKYVKPSAAKESLAKMQQDALVDIEAQTLEMDAFEKQYKEFIKNNPILSKGMNPRTPDALINLAEGANPELESLKQRMGKINLEALVKNMRGLSKNFDTAKEAAALEAIKFKIDRGQETTEQMIQQVRDALKSAKKKISRKAVKDMTDAEIEGVVQGLPDDAAAKRARLEELRKKKAAQGGN